MAGLKVTQSAMGIMTWNAFFCSLRWTLIPSILCDLPTIRQREESKACFHSALAVVARKRFKHNLSATLACLFDQTCLASFGKRLCPASSADETCLASFRAH